MVPTLASKSMHYFSRGLASQPFSVSFSTTQSYPRWAGLPCSSFLALFRSSASSCFFTSGRSGQYLSHLTMNETYMRALSSKKRSRNPSISRSKVRIRKGKNVKIGNIIWAAVRPSWNRGNAREIMQGLSSILSTKLSVRVTTQATLAQLFLLSSLIKNRESSCCKSLYFSLRTDDENLVVNYSKTKSIISHWDRLYMSGHFSGSH